MSSIDAMLLYTFHENDLGYDSHNIEAFFEILELASNAPLFGLGRSKFAKLGTKMLLYNLEEMYGMSNVCFLALLR